MQNLKFEKWILKNFVKLNWKVLGKISFPWFNFLWHFSWNFVADKFHHFCAKGSKQKRRNEIWENIIAPEKTLMRRSSDKMLAFGTWDSCSIFAWGKNFQLAQNGILSDKWHYWKLGCLWQHYLACTKVKWQKDAHRASNSFLYKKCVDP